MKKLNIQKPDFKSLSFKGGAYTAGFSLVAIILAVALIFVSAKLNITFDLTKNGLYSITKDTKEYLAELEDDITIYYLEPDGSSVDVFSKILEQIDKASKHVKVVVTDPVLHPTFASAYTDSEDVNYAVIVVNESNGKYRFIPEEEYVITDYSINYQTYSYDVVTTGLDLEGKIDSAIGYVLSDNSVKIYQSTGHGEATLGSETLSLISKANMEAETIKLMSVDEIPEDCSVLIIQTPQNDFTEDEAAIFAEYLAKGGKAIVNLSYMDAEHPNLTAVIAEYGVKLSEGIIFDRENRMNRIYPAYYFIANVTAADINDGIYNKKYVVSQGSTPLLTDSTSENLSQTNLLYTSNSAYVKSIDAATSEQEEGDTSGIFYFGCKMSDSNTGAEICVFSSLGLFADDFANKSSYGNINLLINSINDLSGAEEASIAVRAIDLTQEETLSIPSGRTAIILAGILLLLPLASLIIGISIIVVRRKRG